MVMRNCIHDDRYPPRRPNAERERTIWLTPVLWPITVIAAKIAQPTILPMSTIRMVSTRPSPRTIPSAPRTQLIGAMLAPAQIHICCGPVESLSRSGIGSMLCASSRTSDVIASAMSPSGCPPVRNWPGLPRTDCWERARAAEFLLSRVANGLSSGQCKGQVLKSSTNVGRRNCQWLWVAADWLGVSSWQGSAFSRAAQARSTGRGLASAASRSRRSCGVPLARVGDEQAARGADPPDRRDDLLGGGVLPGGRDGAVAELGHGAEADDLLDGVEVEVGDLEERVGDDDLLDADVARLLDQRDDLRRREVTGAEDRLVLGDQCEHLLDHRLELAVDVGDPDALGLDAAAALRVVAAGAAVDLRVVAGVDRRHPDLLAAQPQRRLDRGGIDAADVGVEHHAAEHADAGHDPLDQVGAGHRALVVALEHQRLEARVPCRHGDVDVVGEPREEVGVGVAVQVDGAVEADQRSPVRTCGHVGSDREGALGAERMDDQSPATIRR